MDGWEQKKEEEMKSLILSKKNVRRQKDENRTSRRMIDDRPSRKMIETLEKKSQSEDA